AEPQENSSEDEDIVEGEVIDEDK
ncbi:MAG: hypothetical protein RL228_764, partial [Actinomycetota bacterium]